MGDDVAEEVRRLRAELRDRQQRLDQLTGGPVKMACQCCGAAVVRSARLPSGMAQCARCASVAEQAITGQIDLNSLSDGKVMDALRCLMTFAPQAPPMDREP